MATFNPDSTPAAEGRDEGDAPSTPRGAGEQRNVQPTSLYGSLSPYNESESWEDYIEILEYYFAANSIIDDTMKVNILCATVGPKTYKLMKTLCLPKKPNQCGFHELVECLNKHFKPPPTEATESLRFGKRDRKEGESINMYVAELRKIAEHCNFGSYLHRALRDRLLTGCNDSAMQREMLKLPSSTFTLQKAVQVCEACESTSRNLKEIQNAVNHNASGDNSCINKLHREARATNFKGANGPVGKQNCSQGSVRHQFPRNAGFASRAKPQQQQQDRVCYRCGEINCRPDKCPYKNKICFYCKKRGHAKAACRSRDIKHVDDADDLEDETVINSLFMYNIRSKVPPVMITLSINNTDVKCELDTGSPATILNEEDGRKVFKGGLERNAVQLKSYTGHQLDIVGSGNATIKYKNKHCNMSVVVAKGHMLPNLIGRDVIDALSLMTINHVDDESHGNMTLKDVLDTNEEVFRDELGTLHGVKASIHVNADAQPRFFKPRSLPFAMKTKVEAELERLLELKVIEPVTYANWAAPIVPVLKSNGTVRICGDYKVTVNQASRLEQYPIPKLEDLCFKLTGGQKFTKLDLSQAYSQLLLDDESKSYTTISTHRGLFQYTRLPFGISSAPAIFQRTIESLLQGIPFVAVYFDDILITGRSEAEHIATLNVVLEKLRNAGLRLKQSKCELMADEVIYLGHKVDKHGVRPVSDKVQAINEAKVPEKLSELQSFLGLLNYYHHFLPNLSTCLAPLHKLLKKGQKWEWKKPQQDCFDKVKQLICSAKVLAHYDPEKELILQCDASPYGVGAVLSVQGTDEHERPVGFASRTLNTSEKNYSQIDKEGLAVMFGLKKFHKYLYGRHFSILTDHKPLISLFNEMKQVPTTASPRIQRWAITLRAYEYEIRYKPGNKNGNADCLSRLPLPVTEKETAEERVLLIDELDCSPVTAAEVSRLTSKDPVLAQIKKYILRGWSEELNDAQYSPFLVHRNEMRDACCGGHLW